MKREFITVKEASEITGLSIHSVRNRVNKGIFKTIPRSSKNEKMLIYRESIFGQTNSDKTTE
jgi:hypothetical protein